MRLAWILGWLLGSVMMLLGFRALAEVPSGAPPPPMGAVGPADAPPPRKWYGGQTLIVEGVTIAAVAAGLAIDSPLNSGARCRWVDNVCFREEPPPGPSLAEVLFYPGVAGYMLGPPIVHIAHDRWGIAAASFGMRFAPPILLVMGRAICMKEWPCLLPGLASVVGVAALDAAVYSYDNPQRGASAASVAPWIDPRGRAGGFSLSGTF